MMILDSGLLFRATLYVYATVMSFMPIIHNI